MKDIPFSYTLIFALLLIVVAGAGYVLFVDQPVFENEQKETDNMESIRTAQSLKNGTSTGHQKPRQKVEGYDGPYTYDLGAINDPQLTEFVINTALEQCPFYEDGGAVYRSCIYDLRERSVANTNIASTTMETIKKDCSRTTGKHIGSGSTVAHEIYSLCVTEKVVNTN